MIGALQPWMSLNSMHILVESYISRFNKWIANLLQLAAAVFYMQIHTHTHIKSCYGIWPSTCKAFPWIDIILALYVVYMLEHWCNCHSFLLLEVETKEKKNFLFIYTLCLSIKEKWINIDFSISIQTWEWVGVSVYVCIYIYIYIYIKCVFVYMCVFVCEYIHIYI